MENIKLSDIYLGSIDAKNEFIQDDNRGARYLGTYLVPENVNPDNFLNGSLYYVTGLKGIGKTALLYYLATLAQNNGDTAAFVLFKSDISEDEKLNLQKNEQAIVIDRSTGSVYIDDYEKYWQNIIYKIIYEKASQEPSLFKNTKSVNSYLEFFSSLNNAKSDQEWLRFFPKAKKGNLEISADCVSLIGKLNIDFEWEGRTKNQVSIVDINRMANRLLSKLESTDKWLYIFVDELELSIGHKAAYERDGKLIRDLVVTIEKMNANFRKNAQRIRVIAGIRSEVLNVSSGLGKEINKPINDFGCMIRWNLSGGSKVNHPLLQMVYKRITFSEMSVGLGRSDEDSVWERYFPGQINGRDTTSHLLHNSWYRPRDLVRRLGLIAKAYPGESSFHHNFFDSTKKQYSTDSWTELSEELRVKYKEGEIRAIKRLFYGYKRFFHYNELVGHMKEKASIYSEVRTQLNGIDLGTLLEDLYRIGVIGNGEKHNMRFAFRGDDELLLEQVMVIHPALWSYFSLSS